jgi:hypothetical protein
MDTAMTNPNNRELAIDELDIVNGGKGCCSMPEGPNDRATGSGLGWLRNLGAEISGAVGGVVKTIGSIIGL